MPAEKTCSACSWTASARPKLETNALPTSRPRRRPWPKHWPLLLPMLRQRTAMAVMTFSTNCRQVHTSGNSTAAESARCEAKVISSGLWLPAVCLAHSSYQLVSDTVHMPLNTLTFLLPSAYLNVNTRQPRLITSDLPSTQSWAAKKDPVMTGAGAAADRGDPARV